MLSFIKIKKYFLTYLYLLIQNVYKFKQNIDLKKYKIFMFYHKMYIK